MTLKEMGLKRVYIYTQNKQAAKQDTGDGNRKKTQEEREFKLKVLE